MRKITVFAFLSLTVFLLTGCEISESFTMNFAVGYALATIFSVFLLIGYILLIKRKDIWMTALFISVILVNLGYLFISISTTVEQALHANRLAYFGAVILPLAMSMITNNICKAKQGKWFNDLMIGISIFIFLVAASPGYLSIYYESVSLSFVDGATVLEKNYGSWHFLYLLYLLSHFTLMTVTVIRSYVTGATTSSSNVFVLLTAVFVNFLVWVFEQMISGVHFEFLSISYNITEIFLLNMYLIQQDNDRINAVLRQRLSQLLEEQAKSVVQQVTTPEPPSPADSEPNEQLSFFTQNLTTLTPKEREIYDCYLQGMKTSDILTTLNIKENTLKYHNKNIYSKLGVSSRKELEQMARSFRVNT